MELHALPVAEHVVVAQLDEAGEAALAGVAGAGRSGPDGLLLHLEDDVDVGALGRGEVGDDLLEESQAHEVALAAHQCRAAEPVALAHRDLAPDDVLTGRLVASDRHQPHLRGLPLGDLEHDVHHRVAHRLLRLDVDVEVAGFGVVGVGLAWVFSIRDRSYSVFAELCQ
jgi:hypothetical protein